MPVGSIGAEGGGHIYISLAGPISLVIMGPAKGSHIASDMSPWERVSLEIWGRGAPQKVHGGLDRYYTGTSTAI